MSAFTQVYVGPTTKPVDYEAGQLRLGIDCAVSFADGNTLRKVARLLWAEADRVDQNHEQSQRDLREMVEHVAEIRREQGQIAPDGICWDCKIGDHKGHKEYIDGRCYGCGCEGEPDPADVPVAERFCGTCQKYRRTNADKECLDCGTLT